MYNGENKVYFYGFDKLHQLQGNPWHLTGSWITIQNIKDTARKMMRRLNTTEVIVLLVRALDLGSRGREFESRHLDHTNIIKGE